MSPAVLYVGPHRLLQPFIAWVRYAAWISTGINITRPRR